MAADEQVAHVDDGPTGRQRAEAFGPSPDPDADARIASFHFGVVAADRSLAASAYVVCLGDAGHSAGVMRARFGRICASSESAGRSSVAVLRTPTLVASVTIRL